MTNLLEIPKNNSKDSEKIQIIIFKIKIGTRKFTVKLLEKKLEKIVKVTSKVLAKQLVIFLDIQFLLQYFFYYSQAIFLRKIFI